MSGEGAYLSGGGELLPELSGAELAMSLSPCPKLLPHQLHHLQHLGHAHSTPFSVTDILSPIEESYRKLELAANPPSPYRFTYNLPRVSNQRRQ